MSNNLELLSFQKMYGLWGYLLKAKALAPINAGRVLKGGWYLNDAQPVLFFEYILIRSLSTAMFT